MLVREESFQPELEVMEVAVQAGGEQGHQELNVCSI